MFLFAIYKSFLPYNYGPRSKPYLFYTVFLTGKAYIA